VHLTTCASGSGAMPPAAVWRLRDSRDLFDDSGDTAVAKKSNGTDDWNSSTVRSTSGTNATCAVKGCTNKIPDNVQKSINNECRKQSIKLVEYTSRPGYKCLCNSHYESLEIKKVVDELPLDSGKVRKASAKYKTVNKVEKVKTESATDKSALQEILQSVSNAKSVWTGHIFRSNCRTAVPWCLLPKVLLSSTVVQTGSPIPYVRSTGSNVSKMYSRAVRSTPEIQ
jgi:hypothetical protein